MYDIFQMLSWQAIARHDNLSVPFLEYVVDILDHAHVSGEDDDDQGNISDHLTLPLSLSRRSQAATLALQEVCRYIDLHGRNTSNVADLRVSNTYRRVLNRYGLL